MENNDISNTPKSQKAKDKYVGSHLSDFEIIKQLGKGSYGTVYVVKSRIDSNTYVMKKMELNHLKESQQRECYREVSILRKVSHPNIIKYYASFLENESLCIIMEYAELGDLYSLIKHYKRHQKYFDEILLWRISYEILTGLDYLHSNSIIHRDIKCLNLFLSKDHHVKIGDLGVSTISGLGGMHCTRVGTPLYLSPELIKQVPYDYKTDIWSFGCSLYHLACLEPPFTGNNLIVLGNNIVKGRPRELPGIYSNELKSFIEKMLIKNPNKRPSAKEAKDLIPKNLLDKIFLAYKNRIEIKSRPFSSIGNRKNIDNNNNDINNNLNNRNDENKNDNKDNYKNNNKDNNKENNNNKDNINNKENINNKDNINNNEEKNNKEIKKEKNENNIHNIINNNNNSRNNSHLKEIIPSGNSLDINNNKINILSIDSNTGNKINDNNINKNGDNNISEDKKNLKIKQNSNNNLGEKSNSLYNVLNSQRGFNFFRNNFNYKKPKDKKIPKHNIIQSNNKIINNTNNKTNSIKVYSAAFKKELIEFNKDKRLPKFSEEEKIIIDSQKKEVKKPFPTESNIQFISINNNIIINNINNNCLSNNSNTNNTNNSNTNNTNNINNSINPKETILKNNNDIKPIKTEKNTLEIKLSDRIANKGKNKDKDKNKDNILFPNLEVNKPPTNINNINNNKIIQERDFLNPKRKRPLSSGGQFKPRSNRIIASSFNKNVNNQFNLNNNVQKRLNSGRPMTGFKSNFNNNVMNININFFNIDMNKRFLAPEINPLNLNDIDKDKKDILKKSNRFYGSNINLNDYKNTNEFIFQKLIKAIQDINTQKKLTINDLQ